MYAIPTNFHISISILKILLLSYKQYGLLSLRYLNVSGSINIANVYLILMDL